MFSLLSDGTLDLASTSMYQNRVLNRLIAVVMPFPNQYQFTSCAPHDCHHQEHFSHLVIRSCPLQMLILSDWDGWEVFLLTGHVLVAIRPQRSTFLQRFVGFLSTLFLSLLLAFSDHHGQNLPLLSDCGGNPFICYSFNTRLL